MSVAAAPSESGPGVERGPRCICCGADAWAPRFRVLRACAGCGFLRAAVGLDEEEVKRLYREDYFRGKEYRDYLAESASHRKNSAHRWELLRRAAGPVRSLFEIGCAYGFWLEHCATRGVECAGVDLCEEAVGYAVRVLGQRAYAGNFLELPLPAGHYEAFCLWDTVEHLAEPDEYVARAHELLPPGGWLFLSTGDVGSRLARWRGRRWRMIHPPTHLQYFSRATMARFLGGRGFEVVAVRSLSTCRTVGETLGRLNNLGRGLGRGAGRALGAVLPGWLQDVGIWLDLGDIMFVAARKR